MPASVTDLLNQVFGYDRFRGQQEAVRAGRVRRAVRAGRVRRAGVPGGHGDLRRANTDYRLSWMNSGGACTTRSDQFCSSLPRQTSCGSRSRFLRS